MTAPSKPPFTAALNGLAAAPAAPRRVLADGEDFCPSHGVWKRRIDACGVPRWLPNCPQCVAEAQAASVLDRAAIPPRFRGKRLDDFNPATEGQRRALEIATTYAMGFTEMRKQGTCMLFVGRPGTGKTHLACAIAAAVMTQRRTAMYATVQDIIRAVRDTWRKDSERSESEVIRQFVAVDLLIIDEVGIQTGSDDEHRLLFGVIGARHAELRPMILMSNLPVTVSDDERVRGAKSVKDYLGPRIYDRIREGGGKLVTFDWESYRGKV